MTEKIEKLLNALNEKKYRAQRKPIGKIDFGNMDILEQQLKNFQTLLALDTPKLYEDDDFGFNITIDFKQLYCSGNLTPNYYRVMTKGFDEIIKEIKEKIKTETQQKKIEYARYMLQYIEACLEVCDLYKECAREKGNERLYNALSKIPRKPAESFYEACVFIKLSGHFMRYTFSGQLGLGRFDQYMYPFYLKDKAKGISDEEIFETIESFFISLNFDTDLHCGMQQGDNGQSMTLGGYDKDGKDMYNELSKMCMQASLELSVIDPKINLRVGKNTPYEIYEYATLLTKQGLGFPQYCNDDVVVPGLVKLGYDLEDALNYTVAACWEFIIPNCGADVPNIGTMNFPLVVNNAIKESLMQSENFEELMEYVAQGIIKRGAEIRAEKMEEYLGPEMPLLSIFIDGCLESLTDIWRGGAKYCNYGCHGAGIANATDALAAVRKNIYDEKRIQKADLLEALEKNFVGFEELQKLLKNSPKMGNNDDYADDIALQLMKTFSQNMNNSPNGKNGVWRAGTGSAHEYIYSAQRCPATADGRKAFEPYSSSFSPSLDVKTTGLLSVIQSFTKYDMTEIINGGPLTIEIHDTVLRNEEGIKKTAMLVKNFIALGGHQLQLNSINKEKLLDAQKHPEKYPNLIVRVWGWSGYFNELDVIFQNHIIRRCDYAL